MLRRVEANQFPDAEKLVLRTEGTRNLSLGGTNDDLDVGENPSIRSEPAYKCAAKARWELENFSRFTTTCDYWGREVFKSGGHQELCQI